MEIDANILYLYINIAYTATNDCICPRDGAVMQSVQLFVIIPAVSMLVTYLMPVQVNYQQTTSELETSNINVCTGTAFLDPGLDSTAVQEEVSQAFFVLPTTVQPRGTKSCFMFGQARQISCQSKCHWGTTQFACSLPELP